MKINMKTTSPKDWAEKFVKLHGGDVDLMEDWFEQALDAGWNAGRKVANENHAKHLFYRTHGHSPY